MQREEKLKKLVDNASESLDVELKKWLDPTSPEGIAKIARACMALRNNDGGYLIIGFQDDGTPDFSNVPADIRRHFHVDVIQQIVSKYATPPFGIRVDFVERDGCEYPVISVPSGIQKPVVAKSDLNDSNDRKAMIRDNAVYVRTVNSNNTVSSSEARKGDWDNLLTRCFDNREADIGRFVRRHLTGISQPEWLAPIVNGLRGDAFPTTVEQQVLDIFSTGYERFRTLSVERVIELLAIGYREFAVKIDGVVPVQRPTEQLLNELDVNKPRHSGWSPWLVLGASSDHSLHPFVFEQAWEAFLPFLTGGFLSKFGIDFWRLNPNGEFYHIRGLEDDFAAHSLPQAPSPGTQLDFQMQVSRLAEAISVILTFGRVLGCDIESTSFLFAVRWRGLKGRRLTSWVSPSRGIVAPQSAVQDEVTATVKVPSDIPPSRICDYVEALLRDLTILFGGLEVPSSVIRSIVDETLSRQM